MRSFPNIFKQILMKNCDFFFMSQVFLGLAKKWSFYKVNRAIGRIFFCLSVHTSQSSYKICLSSSKFLVLNPELGDPSVDQYKTDLPCLNKQVIKAVDYILEHDKTDPIILILRSSDFVQLVLHFDAIITYATQSFPHAPLYTSCCLRQK